MEELGLKGFELKRCSGLLAWWYWGLTIFGQKEKGTRDETGDAKAPILMHTAKITSNPQEQNSYCIIDFETGNGNVYISASIDKLMRAT